ncbi:MAG: hypothetical protein HWN67_17710 [Candidatus Helarchaeota archaeon]|nr:hypothetical protein [Candidatus Helarchaeota archaeon]
MEKDNYYKYLFLIAALWNIILGTLFFLMSITDPSAVFPTEIIIPSLFPIHGLISLVIAYGIGYFLVSRDIDQNHGIVIIGIIGKLLIFLCSVVYYGLGELQLLNLLIGIGDLIFACLFIEFLIYKK